LNFLSTAIVSLVYAFLLGWHLALVISIFAPIFSYVSTFTIKGFMLIGAETAKAYAKSGGIADQTFRLLKTIISYNKE
jgi:ABC-type multidrug transport system fused ATPase/permease subunit